MNEFSLFPLRYLIAVQKCLGLYSDNGQYSADDVERLSALYNSLKEKYAWSSAVKVN
jgi:peptide alpha-N-acetyltransferase